MRKDVCKLTSELRQEHASILQRLNQLTNSVHMPVDKMRDSAISKMTRGFKELLVSHLAKEEDELFSILSEAIGEGDIIEAVREEHRRLRDSVERLSMTSDLKRFCDSFRDTLQKHISKEEKVLFWLAEVRTRGQRV